MVNFNSHLTAETERLIDAVGSAVTQDPATMSRTVPSCPDWTVADLVWHITEVQDFWGYMLASGADGPASYNRPSRPADDHLINSLASRLTTLTAALSRGDDDLCWSWSETGGTVRWVRRRQAQEALVHRVDAELAVNQRTAIDESLAEDGVDEMLTVMLSGLSLPSDLEFIPDQGSVVLATDTRRWVMHTGRASGRSVIQLLPDDGPRALAGTTTISGTGADINLWLWGRQDRSALTIEGSDQRADDLRSLAAEITGL